MLVPRLLATGSAVGAATAARIGVASLGLVARRTPTLVRLGAAATGGSDGAGRAQSVFRDELIGLYREAAELSWRELRRGVDEFDLVTRPDGEATAGHRPYRVKP